MFVKNNYAKYAHIDRALMATIIDNMICTQSHTRLTPRDIVDAENVKCSVLSVPGGGVICEITIINTVQSTKSITLKLRKAYPVKRDSGKIGSNPAFVAMSSMNRIRPSKPPVTSVVSAAKPVARFQRIPVRNTAAIGAPIYACMLCRY